MMAAEVTVSFRGYGGDSYRIGSIGAREAAGKMFEERSA
jgi:hypothetical protein